MATDPGRPAKSAEPDAGHVPITEEFDRPKWTLPAAPSLAAALAVVAVAVGIVAFATRAQRGASGSITQVNAVETQDKNVLATVHISVQNLAEKPLWIKEIKVTVRTSKGEFTDDAASAVDFERYFQAYPQLRESAMEPLKPEMRIAPGGQQQGMVLVAFPVDKATFDQRTGLSVTIENYDRTPLVISR